MNDIIVDGQTYKEFIYSFLDFFGEPKYDLEHNILLLFDYGKKTNGIDYEKIVTDLYNQRKKDELISILGCNIREFKKLHVKSKYQHLDLNLTDLNERHFEGKFVNYDNYHSSQNQDNWRWDADIKYYDWVGTIFIEKPITENNCDWKIEESNILLQKYLTGLKNFLIAIPLHLSKDPNNLLYYVPRDIINIITDYMNSD